MKGKKAAKSIIYNAIILAIGLIMIYPLVWMIMSSFKETNIIFKTAGQLIPKKWVLDNYINGWKGFGGVSFGRFFSNSLFIAVVATIGTIVSSALVGFGFSRFQFRGKGILFAAMLASMMLPAQVLMIPQYLWYQKLGWVGSYLPLIVILPLLKPALTSACIFSFMWRWDDFLSALLYVQKSVQYPVSLALKLFCDPGSSSDYGAMFAMATISIIPSILIFLIFQRYLVDGISTSGLKG